MKDAFSTYHPIVIFMYFAVILGFIMYFQQPICLALAAVSAMGYGICLCGKRTVRFSLRYLLPMAGMILLINPLVNHQGLTILGYFPNGNPFTLESILYGILTAGILIALILWCSCWNQVMTTDKLVYLFGRILPVFSLVISMTLRFIPRYRNHLKEVAEAQRQLGRGGKDDSWFTKFRFGIRVLSGTLTWAMEHAIETANSMKSRGYGLPGRTAFSLYRWRKRDTGLLVLILLLGGIVLLGAMQGRLYWTCFPSVMRAETDAVTIGIYFCYGILFLLPVLIREKEEWKWKHSFR